MLLLIGKLHPEIIKKEVDEVGNNEDFGSVTVLFYLGKGMSVEGSEVKVCLSSELKKKKGH